MAAAMAAALVPMAGVGVRLVLVHVRLNDGVQILQRCLKGGSRCRGGGDGGRVGADGGCRRPPRSDPRPSE